VTLKFESSVVDDFPMIEAPISGPIHTWVLRSQAGSRGGGDPAPCRGTRIRGSYLALRI